MFGDMPGMLQAMKQKMEDAKKRMDLVSVEAEIEGGAIKVIATANREIKSISISDDLKNGEKEELEDLLTVAVNRALAKAEQVYNTEMASLTHGIIPPGML